ncbi:hypothetical protein C7D74_31725, partial [Klebsiella pneumoniae]
HRQTALSIALHGMGGHGHRGLMLPAQRRRLFAPADGWPVSPSISGHLQIDPAAPTRAMASRSASTTHWFGDIAVEAHRQTALSIALHGMGGHGHRGL